MENGIIEKFSRLMSELSPENLYCDGEISKAQAQIKYRRLKGEWLKLEKEVGRSVSEDEILNILISQM